MMTPVAALLGWMLFAGAFHPGRWYTYLETLAEDRSVEFYGQVVGEDGMPIEGVAVKVRISRANLWYILGFGNSYDPKWIDAVTDGQGSFRVARQRGWKVEINDLFKYGFVFDVLDRVNGVRSFRFSRVMPNEIHVPDPNNPVVWTLRPATEENLAKLDRVTRRRYERRARQE